MTPGADTPQALAPSLAAAADALTAAFGDRIVERSDFRGDLTFSVTPEAWLDVLTFCRDDAADGFRSTRQSPGRSSAGARLRALRRRGPSRFSHPRASPAGQDRSDRGTGGITVTGLWPSAGFDEREAWEMYGIGFTGHPNLIRLLTTEDFEDFPMRKDFPLEGTFGGRVRTDLRGKI